MNWLLALPRLVRLPNLIIVFLSQAIPYWVVLRPAIAKAGAVPVLTTRTFGLLSLGTLLTTLGGYMLNDYFDRYTDAINKPNRSLVGRIIPANVWLVAYWVMLFALTAVALTLYQSLGASSARTWPLWIFMAISAGLFLYAWQLKCSPILGNVFVSMLAALAPVLVFLPEDRAIWLATYHAPDLMTRAMGQMWLYALFGFVVNLLREQIKDIVDFEGDAACSCHTLAVLKGIPYARKMAMVTGLFVAGLQGLLLYYWTLTGAPGWQVTAGLFLMLLPALLTTWMLSHAVTKKHFVRAGYFVSLLFLAGLLLLVREWPVFFKP